MVNVMIVEDEGDGIATCLGALEPHHWQAHPRVYYQRSKFGLTHAERGFESHKFNNFLEGRQALRRPQYRASSRELPRRIAPGKQFDYRPAAN